MWAPLHILFFVLFSCFLGCLISLSFSVECLLGIRNLNEFLSLLISFWFIVFHLLGAKHLATLLSFLISFCFIVFHLLDKGNFTQVFSYNTYPVYSFLMYSFLLLLSKVNDYFVLFFSLHFYLYVLLSYQTSASNYGVASP